jgi:hypothetical protein
MPDRRTTTWIRALLLAACCAALIGLAACGGDDSDSTSTEAATTTTTTSSEDSGTTTSIPDDAIDASALREEFNKQLLTVLTTQQNLTDSQAQCAIDKLEDTVSDEDLKNAILEAAQTGQPPQDLIDAGFNAGKECADQ